MRGLVFLIATSLLCQVAVQAQPFSAGPFYGYRFGGEFKDAASDQAVQIKDNPSYGIFLDLDPRDTGLRVELLYSQQPTELNLDGLGGSPNQDLNIHVFQIGGLQEFEYGRLRPYLAGYVGATWFDLAGLEDDLRFSFTAAAGVNYYLTKNPGVRLDLRGFGTVVDGDGGFICINGGCVVNFSGDVLWQGEVTASVFLAF
jgi:hypothetical protein